ncbi:MAG: alpha/beta fold hydrolase [Pyrinomonadaceae bacterium]
MKRSLKSLLFLFVILIFADAARAEKTNCDFLGDHTNLGAIECGRVFVPEDHDDPKSKKIRIAYAVLKSKKVSSAGDPVIFFSGGPGGSSLQAGFLGFISKVSLRNERDIIVFDQRGINHSGGLPDIGLDIFNAMAADLDMVEERSRFREILRSFAATAEKAGIGLGNYNSIQSARDVGVLMDSLGYKKYNLFGISYGTRLARLIQDMFPEKVNTSVLDSPNPMTDDFLIDRMRSYSSAAEKIFRLCEKDKECSEKYPRLRETYFSTIKDLKKKPLAVSFNDEIFYLNSQDAMFFLRHRLYRNDALRSFPAFLAAIKNSEKEIIRQAILNERLDSTDGNFNTSMFLAVSVFESMDKSNTPEKIEDLYSGIPNFPEQLGFFTNLYIEGMNWHNKRLPREKREFAVSSIPTMIFVNQYDPVTPPENGEVIRRRLTNSHLYVLDEGGHSGGDTECKMRVMAGFMSDPDRKPDASCLKIFDPDSGIGR